MPSRSFQWVGYAPMHPIQMCKLELLQVHRKVTDGVLGTVPFWLSKPLIMSRQIPSRTGRSSNYVLQNLQQQPWYSCPIKGWIHYACQACQTKCNFKKKRSVGSKNEARNDQNCTPAHLLVTWGGKVVPPMGKGQWKGEKKTSILCPKLTVYPMNKYQ